MGRIRQMDENLENERQLSSSFDNMDIQVKKRRLLEIEKEQESLNRDLGNILEKVADTKTKLADKVESLSEEAFIDLAAKNKICLDLLKKIEKLKLSNDPELKETEFKLDKATEEKNKAKQRSNDLSSEAIKFRTDANMALDKAKKHLEHGL